MDESNRRRSKCSKLFTLTQLSGLIRFLDKFTRILVVGFKSLLSAHQNYSKLLGILEESCPPEKKRQYALGLMIDGNSEKISIHHGRVKEFTRTVENYNDF